jgi:hypothetical protein
MMRFRNGLALFARTSDRRSWNVASYHSPHSMTWRWLISFSLFRGDEWRVRPLWWSHTTTDGLQWGCRVPWIGIVRFQQQRPMWFRDLYQQLRDRFDGLSGVPRPEPPPPPRQPFAPTVVDGGSAIH